MSAGDSPGGGPDSPQPADLGRLLRADEYLARAGRLYDRDPRRFAFQRVVVALERAQLAWRTDGPRSPAAQRFAAQACRTLGQVDPSRRRQAAQAVAVVSAFLLAEAGRTEEALAWFAQTGYQGGAGETGEAGAAGPGAPARGVSLEEFRGSIASGWRYWLAPVRSDSSAQPPGRRPAAEPPAEPPPAEAPLWPARPIPLPALLGW